MRHSQRSRPKIAHPARIKEKSINRTRSAWTYKSGTYLEKDDQRGQLRGEIDVYKIVDPDHRRHYDLVHSDDFGREAHQVSQPFKPDNQ
jgi:hypothetical protein